jgi:hypothetical protein
MKVAAIKTVTIEKTMDSETGPDFSSPEGSFSSGAASIGLPNREGARHAVNLECEKRVSQAEAAAPEGRARLGSAPSVSVSVSCLLSESRDKEFNRLRTGETLVG